MNIYHNISDALNMSRVHFDCEVIEGVDIFSWKTVPPWNKGIPRTENEKKNAIRKNERANAQLD